MSGPVGFFNRTLWLDLCYFLVVIVGLSVGSSALIPALFTESLHCSPVFIALQQMESWKHLRPFGTELVHI